jgi:hypothetical protein
MASSSQDRLKGGNNLDGIGIEEVVQSLLFVDNSLLDV